MKSRAEIQSAHEFSVLHDGLAEHNRIHDLNLTVISRPDPPDAILSDGLSTTWMEVTDAFFSEEWATDLSSYDSIKGHKPMARGLYMDMDKQFAINFCNLIIKKTTKNSYKPLVQKYGPGILVVGLESPWLDDETFYAIDVEWIDRGSPDISQTFAYVYLRRRGIRTFAWLRS